MEDWFAMQKRKARQAKRQKIVNGIKEAVGGVVFIALMWVFAALCTICSGYHWE